jgi:hypothetical protein
MTPTPDEAPAVTVSGTRTLADLVTPALIVDVPALDRNITTMARFFAYCG